MEKSTFDYDSSSDSLIISRKRGSEKVQGSAEIGNLVLDFSSEGRILNVEFGHISEFLKMMNVNPSILSELIGANLIVQKQRGAVVLFANLQTPMAEQSIPLATIPVGRELSLA